MSTFMLDHLDTILICANWWSGGLVTKTRSLGDPPKLPMGAVRCTWDIENAFLGRAKCTWKPYSYVRSDALVPSSDTLVPRRAIHLFLVAMHLFLVAMHLFLVAL